MEAQRGSNRVTGTTMEAQGQQQSYKNNNGGTGAATESDNNGGTGVATESDNHGGTWITMEVQEQPGTRIGMDAQFL